MPFQVAQGTQRFPIDGFERRRYAQDLHCLERNFGEDG